MLDEQQAARTGQSRRRPARRVGRQAEEGPPDALTEELQGVAAAYGSVLLFIGYMVKNKMEIVIFPRYRFSSDDRVQGHLGTIWVKPGTPWGEILPQAETTFAAAERYYRRAVTTHAAEARAHGVKYEEAYAQITDLFRESWHGFALRLRRTGRVERSGVVFEGKPPGPLLVRVGSATYTLHVAPTGSILLATGDKREAIAD